MHIRTVTRSSSLPSSMAPPRSRSRLASFEIGPTTRRSQLGRPHGTDRRVCPSARACRCTPQTASPSYSFPDQNCFVNSTLLVEVNLVADNTRLCSHFSLPAAGWVKVTDFTGSYHDATAHPHQGLGKAWR